MAGEQRKCANCRFFRDAGIAGNGWCTHPKRQTTSDARLLVRAGELACRNSWGNDLFQSRNDPDIAADAGDDMPIDSDLPGGSRDDEVTSVITRPSHASDRPDDDSEDRVVSDRPAPARRDEDDGYNDAAHRDQAERARVIARGSRDALVRARERHFNRRQHTSAEQDEEPGEPVPARRDRIAAHQARFTDRKRTRFTPAPEGAEPVPREEVMTRTFRAADRFDSIPEIDPGFDLPGWRSGDVAEHDADDVPPADQSDREESGAEIETQALQQPEHAERRREAFSSYEHALERARRAREERLKSNRPIRHAPATGVRQQRGTVGEAPSRLDHAPVERWADELEGVESVPSHAPVEHDSTVDFIADHDDELPDWESDIHGRDDEPAVFDDDSDAGEMWEDTTYAEHDGDDEDVWYDDEPVAEPTPQRRRGLLARLGLGRSRQDDWHDDGMVTRHADFGTEAQASGETWWSEEDDRLVDEVFDDDVDAEETDDRWLNEANDVPWDDRGDTKRYSAVAHDNIIDDTWSEPRVAEAEAAFHERDDRPLVRQQRHESMHRQRLAPELPDLDDNLFEERFERGTPSQRATLPFDRDVVRESQSRLEADDDFEEPAPVPASERYQAPAPSESYFRAARFRDWAETHAGRQDDDLEDDRRVRLPDLDEPAFNLREMVERGNELIDMTIDIAPEIPRACRTCRSFRSADGGARGWCTNEWAFTHRRMVNEDDLACDSTIGCWWLPADRYWLIEEQDGYAATPRMDRLIARRQDQADRSVSGAS